MDDEAQNSERGDAPPPAPPAGPPTGPPVAPPAGPPPSGPPPSGPPTSGPPHGAPPPGHIPYRPQGRPPGRPPLPPADEATVRAVMRRARTFLLLLLAALATTTLPLPLRAASLAFVGAAIVLGAVTLRRTWRPGLREQVAPLLVFGLAFAVLLATSMAGTFLLWPVETARQECLDHAVTISARAQCEETYQDGVQDRIDQLVGRD